KPGESAERAFIEDGTYYYFCALHPWMRGAVVVGSGRPNFGLGLTPPYLPPVLTPPLPPLDAYAYPFGGFPPYYGSAGYFPGPGSGPAPLGPYFGYPGYGLPVYLNPGYGPSARPGYGR